MVSLTRVCTSVGRTGAEMCRPLPLAPFHTLRAPDPASIPPPRKVVLDDSYTLMILVGAYRSKGQLARVIDLHQEAVARRLELWLPAASNIMYAYSKVSDSRRG